MFRPRLSSLILAGLTGVALSGRTLAAEPKAWVDDHLEEFIELYRYFHQHPELSLSEKETAARVAAELKATGAKVTAGVGGHGVVGVVENKPGPTLLLRTDLDALPVNEQTQLAYASQVKVRDASGAEIGVMHACGHDIHITSLIAVARYPARAQGPLEWDGGLHRPTG